MSLSRALNKAIGRALIAVFLLAQLAVASHACPGLGPSPSPAMQQTAEPSAAEMPDGCGQMDPKAANLCAEHCKFGQQSSDTSPVPAVIAPALTVLYVLPALVESGADGQPVAAPDPQLAAAPPPHAILHCVLRI